MNKILLNQAQYERAKQRMEELLNVSEDLVAEKLSTEDEKRRQHLGHNIRVLQSQIEALNEQIKEYEER